MLTKILSISLFLIFPFFAKSQVDTLTEIDIEAVTISASRVPEKSLILPLPVTKLTFKSSQDARQQISLNEYLTEVPGLFSLNANNYAQDLRISIRGFGARSPFGIRGIKILVDGIPETTPDGQGQIDNLNLEIIKNIEVIRGPTSALYGNASGGVISINTTDYFGENYLQGGLTFGAFNLQKYQLSGGLVTERTRIIAHGSHTSSDGFREHSGFASSSLNIRTIHRFSSRTSLSFLANYTNSPRAEDAGGLDLIAIQSDRKAARDRNLEFDAGESIQHFKFGTSFKHHFDKDNQFQSYVFFAKRDFTGRLPFMPGGYVSLDRSYIGFGGNYQSEFDFKNGSNKIKLGYDAAHMGDVRQRFDNELGQKGELALDQLETFNNIGIYLIDHLSIGKWLFTGGLRYDYNQLIVNDYFTANGNNSSGRVYRKYNPSLSLSYSLSSQHFVYGGFSTSFETPVLSELSANPNGGDGFNRSLKPQEAQNYEVGFKTRNKMGNQQLEIALFHISTENDIVPFELDSIFPGRTFFRNAGSGIRNGIEIEFFKSINKNLRLRTSYTFSRFEYEDYETPNGNFAGNRLPGIPEHMGSVSLAFQKNRFYGRVQTRFNGELFADDANSTIDNAYLLTNLNLGYTFNKENWTFKPFLGVNNLFNVEYNDNVRLNAFGGRYFEPAPGRHLFVGVRVRI